MMLCKKRQVAMMINECGQNTNTLMSSIKIVCYGGLVVENKWVLN